jgi:hypothetical protein
MANSCRTEIHLHANQSTIDWFEKLVKDFTVEDYIEQFGDPNAELLIDKIGSKWLIKYDWYREDEHEYFISFESAWYPPDTLIKNMVAQLQEHDSRAYATGRYWDEAFCPIGIFQCNASDVWETAETDVEVDFEEEYFWDEQIEPAFNNLEL